MIEEASLPVEEASLPEEEASIPEEVALIAEKEPSLPRSSVIITENEESVLEKSASLHETLPGTASSVLLDICCDVLNSSTIGTNYTILLEENQQTSVENVLKNIENIKMPSSQKMKGRPKHSLTTTPIGLPKRDKVEEKQNIVPFRKQPTENKIKKMLKWLVPESVISKSLMGYEIEEHVETIPEKLSSAIVDEEVNINLIEKFFSKDGWLVVQNVVETKKEKHMELQKM